MRGVLKVGRTFSLHYGYLVLTRLDGVGRGMLTYERLAGAEANL